MARVAVVYHSGYGHTAKQAEAAHASAGSVPGSEFALRNVTEMSDVFWTRLAGANAILLGAPTSMGGASAKFKEFADASSGPCFTQAWKNKIAGGFTDSASLAGGLDAWSGVAEPAK